ncbi:MAG TPA: hypothetical protein H9755_07820 [Candidatus Dietzia intestinigallinarum]|nr:hypothetical protein [Candidatus Dietzia intestinigallinarum]
MRESAQVRLQCRQVERAADLGDAGVQVRIDEGGHHPAVLRECPRPGQAHRRDRPVDDPQLAFEAFGQDAPGDA